jgi:hypothetical protein
MSQNFPVIHAQAHAAGVAAMEAAVPVPMVVVGGSEKYFVEGGVCGFAWVSFAGNTAWGKWAKKNKVARSAYPKGLQVWVGGGGQSMQRKEAYAHAFAQVLNANGIQAYAGSRMD